MAVAGWKAMAKPRKASGRGVTLVEVLVVVAIISSVYFMAKVGIVLLNNLMQTSATTRMQQETQMVLYNITKEVRNCNKIVQASSDTLKIQVFNTKSGYSLETNPGIFDTINIGTITYTYVKSGSDSYLKKTIKYPGFPTDEKWLLRNLLLQPDTTDYMFNVCDSIFILESTCPLHGQTGYPVEPFEAVDVRFKMSPSFTKNATVLYSAKEMRRSSAR